MVNIHASWATGSGRAYSVSADGSAVVGYARAGVTRRAFRWTDDLGMVNLQAGSDWATGEGWANSVSADGSVVVGTARDGSATFRAFRWTSDLGMVNLQAGSDWATGDGYANSVSADGSVVVGYAGASGDNIKAFRWTDDLGMVNLQAGSDWATGEGWANSVSADGSVVVGAANDGAEYRAFIYRTGMLDAENTVSAIADNVVAQGTAIAALGAGLSFAAETELDAGSGGQPSTVSISSKSHSDSLPMVIRLGASASSNADTGSLSFGSVSGAIGLSEELTVGGFASLGTEASSLGGLGFDGTITSFGAFVRSTPLGGSGLTWKAALATSGGAVTISRDDSLVGTEAASGSSTLSSTAASFELGYRMAAQNRITTPFLRLAQTSTTRAAYDEDASYDFPIFYDAVTEVVTTATLGLDSRSALDESNTLRLTGGLEMDLARSNSPITGTSDIPNLTSFSIDAADIAAVQNPTRGYVGLGLTHDFGNGAAITFDLRADQNAFTATPTYSGGIAYQMKF
jgi:probable HAF family extracellular repeat protein